MFADREGADRRLVDPFDERDETVDLVLAIPRGGLPVGREIADRLRVSFDVVAASKAGAPDSPELAVGAVAGDGNAWRNEDLLSYLSAGEDYLDREREREATAARDRVPLYRGGDPFLDVVEKCVVVADDGVATGVTARACLRQVVANDVERVILAVPVGPSSTLSELGAKCNAVVVVESPEAFGAVGAFYHDFAQASDEKAATYLHDGVDEH